MIDTKFEEDKAQLNLVPNSEEIIVCKGRIQGEYLRALREQHRLKSGGTGRTITEGEVVIIKSTNRNRNHWHH